MSFIAVVHSGTRSIDALLGEWNVYCQLNSRMHDASRGRFKRLNHGLMIPALLLSSVASLGATSLGAMGLNHSNGPASAVDLPLLMIGVIGLASTCLVSVHRLINAAELQREHDLYSDMFTTLANEIDMQLVLDESGVSKMFTSKHEFVKYCKGRMDVLIDKAPPIPKTIMRKNMASYQSQMSNASIGGL